MKKIDNIEDWYRDELNKYNVEPDKGVWDSLSKELHASSPLTDDNISEWYKKEVVKLEERPDYTVWEKLSTRLDTSSVWNKLVISLNRYEQYILWRNLVLKGSAIFLLFLGSYLAYDNYFDKENLIANDLDITKNNEIKNNVTKDIANKKATYEASFDNPSNKNNYKNKGVNNSNVENSELSNASGLDINEIATTTNEFFRANKTPEEKVEQTIKDANNIISSKLDKNHGRAKENVSYASMKKIQDYYRSIYIERLDELKTNNKRTIYTDINRHQLTERDISYLYASDNFLVKKDKNKIIFNSKRFSSYFMFGLYARRIYVGINSGFKKQGMITKIKKNSPYSEFKRIDFLDFGNNFGGTVGFIVSDNFNIETNVNLNSTAGYKRAYITEGISYQENLNLNYTSISLLAKKMNNKSTFDNKVYSTNLIGGVYFGYLRSSISNINGVSKNLAEYDKTDLGIVIGFEQDRYITKTLVITPGIRYNQGLTNISNDNSPFESSRNFSFEFNLGIKYIFLKKG